MTLYGLNLSLIRLIRRGSVIRYPHHHRDPSVYYISTSPCFLYFSRSVLYFFSFNKPLKYNQGLNKRNTQLKYIYTGLPGEVHRHIGSIFLVLLSNSVRLIWNAASVFTSTERFLFSGLQSQRIRVIYIFLSLYVASDRFQ